MYMVIKQGWLCPICRRVYSPETTMCQICGRQEDTPVYRPPADASTCDHRWVVDGATVFCKSCGLQAK